MSNFLAVLAVLSLTGVPACDEGGETRMSEAVQATMPSGLTPLYRPGMQFIGAITPVARDRNARQEEQALLHQYLDLHAQALAQTDTAALMFWWRLHPMTVADGGGDASQESGPEPMSVAGAGNACS